MVPGNFPRERRRQKAFSVETSPKVNARIGWSYRRRNLIGLHVHIEQEVFFLRHANYSVPSYPPQFIQSRNGNIHEAIKYERQQLKYLRFA